MQLQNFYPNDIYSHFSYAIYCNIIICKIFIRTKTIFIFHLHFYTCLIIKSKMKCVYKFKYQQYNRYKFYNYFIKNYQIHYVFIRVNTRK